jgi:transcription termination factor Rho
MTDPDTSTELTEKPRTRRTTRKSAAEKAEKPAKKTASRTKAKAAKAVEEPAQAPVAAEAAVEEPKKPARKPRATRKKAAPEEPAGVEQAVETPAPAREDKAERQQPAPAAIEQPEQERQVEETAPKVESRAQEAAAETAQEGTSAAPEERPREGGGRHRHRDFRRRRDRRGRPFRDRREESREEQDQPLELEEPQEYEQPVAEGGEQAEPAAPGEAQEPRPRPEPVYGEGVIEISGKGFGFLREAKRGYQQSPQDIFVTPELVRRFSLRDGLLIRGEIRRGARGPQLLRITEINGRDPAGYRDLPVFEELTTINPDRWIRLETVPDRYTTRVIDLMAPIGKGQRGLIVAPPRTGKTTLLQHIADAVVQNHPSMKLIILLVDERPEEVTEIRRCVPQAEIMASSNDSDLKSHTRIAQLAIERAKRLVESGDHVFMLMDSLTRIGRAFNNALANSGRTLSGGMDARAMETPRRLFAAARNTEEAGSLTIVATALIETGSRMDELIFQEFKGTGNMELVLDRRISDQRVYPAVDIFLSGTRREELLLPQEYLEKISVIRRGLSGHKPIEAIERMLSFLRKFPTNQQMLASIPAPQF